LACLFVHGLDSTQHWIAMLSTMANSIALL
jgi:hypothetical protein